MSNDIQDINDRLDRLETNAPEGEPFTREPTSIKDARRAREDATGFTALVAEVDAMEARITDATPLDTKDAVVGLRNKLNGSAIDHGGNSGTNSLVLAKQGVDRVRAHAQAVASGDFGATE